MHTLLHSLAWMRKEVQFQIGGHSFIFYPPYSVKKPDVYEEINFLRAGSENKITDLFVS